VQGAGAAVMMPASLALIRENYADPRHRPRAIALWSLGAVASAAGPVMGGFLTLLSWRLIFFVNLPIDALALYLLTRVARSPRQQEPAQIVALRLLLNSLPTIVRIIAMLHEQRSPNN
jgi:MFS transporter, DHA2 family, methylenomycin A resistance protein